MGSLKPPLPWKFSDCTPALRHYFFAKHSILNVWQCSEYTFLNNCSVICPVTLGYVLHLAHSKFWHNQNSIYSGIYRHIQADSALFRHSCAYWKIIKAYSAPCVNPAFWEACHILSAYLEPEAYTKPHEYLSWHIQNSAIIRTVYSGIIQEYSSTFRTLCKPAYAETWHIWNPGLFRTLPWLHPNTYSEPCHIYKNR